MSGTLVCSECGAKMIRPFKSAYVVCPNGHGKLIKLDKYQKKEWRNPSETAERKKVWASGLPVATKIGRIQLHPQVAIYTIEGRDGFYTCDADSRPTGQTELPEGDVVAKIPCGTSCLARTFRRANLTEKQRSRFEKRVKET